MDWPNVIKLFIFQLCRKNIHTYELIIAFLLPEQVNKTIILVLVIKVVKQIKSLNQYII